MAVRDITTNYVVGSALDIQVINTDTTTAGNIIDTADYDGGVNFILFSGTLTAGTFTPLIEEGDDSGLSDAAAVADTDLIPQDPSSSTAPEAQAAFAATDDDICRKIGYAGSKRYVRISLVSASSANGTIGVVYEKKPEVQPASVS